MQKSMTKDRLLAFAKAWSHKSINDVMHFFTEDCIYKPSVGSYSVEEFSGKTEVRKAIKRMMQFDNSLSSKVSNIQIFGEFGFWEWQYLTKEHESIMGCDVFKFRNDNIVEKNAYRKVTSTTS